MGSIDQLIGEIDGRIARLMPDEGRSTALFGMMKYHLGWVDETFRPVRAEMGKRIRARLCLLACQAVGAPSERAISAATAVELIHNFSLIHDDIQDRSERRRHRRTVWALWGDAQAINVGDGMLTLAQLALTEDQSSAPWVVIRGLRSLNVACRLLCEGQYLDLEYERRPGVTLDDYHAMIERKTAALLEASCLMGALYGGAEERALAAYSAFGRHLGLAFQMRDDYLGIWGDPAATGKPAASDLARKKRTMPVLYALAAAAPPDRAVLEGILSGAGAGDDGAAAEALRILERCGAWVHTAAETARASQAALRALDTAGALEPARTELASLCQRLVLRCS